MKTTIKEFTQEFENITNVFRMFEISVFNTVTQEPDYLIFDIEIIGRSFVASHVALTKKQEKSNRIACIRLIIDTDFSIDHHLSQLHELCINAIITSDFYELTN